MKKKIIISVLIIVALVMLLFFWNKGRNMRLFEKVDITTISKVEIYQNDKSVVITKQEEKEKVVEVLQSMQLDKTKSSNKDGFAYMIDIYYQNGDTMSITLRSKDIVVDGVTYSCDKDCCEEIRQIYESLLEE